MTERQFGVRPDDDDEPMLEPFQHEADESMYSAMREELSKPAEVEPVWLDIPARPNFRMRYYPDISFDDFRAMIKRHTRNKKFNALMFSFSLISLTNTGFAFKGRLMRDDEDQPLTVVSPELHQMMGVAETTECINKLYVTDGAVLQTAQAIAEAAGFGDTDLESDNNPLGI